MREVKYRAWNKLKSQMHYADYGKGTFETNSKWWGINQDDNSVVNCTNGTLMQYTGLKDKNGVEIYEGDIAKVMDMTLAVVKYSSARGAYSLDCGNKVGDVGLICQYDTIEIVGNIYENPELLEVE